MSVNARLSYTELRSVVNEESWTATVAMAIAFRKRANNEGLTHENTVSEELHQHRTTMSNSLCKSFEKQRIE
jgi:hypothetical protein